MAFATRTLIDTGSTDTGSGKIVILIDLSNHDGAGLFLDAHSLTAFANGAKVNIRKMRWGMVSGDISEDASGSVKIEFVGASSNTTAINLAGSGYYDGPMIYGNATNTTATSADISGNGIHVTGFLMMELSKASGWTG